MGQQRSKGVTLFGIIFIIAGLLGLLSSVYSVSVSAVSSYSRPLFSLVSSGLGLVAGIFILQLKEWARKLEIILRLALIVLFIPSFLGFSQINKMITSVDGKQELKKVFDAAMQENFKMYKPEYQEQIRNDYESRYNSIIKILPIIMVVFWSLALIWYISIIFFFTRPKVKEQFQ
ncbi:MAG: hypothetical protein AB1629_01325 [Candidatus Omnitrophota bacterium]